MQRSWVSLACLMSAESAEEQSPLLEGVHFLALEGRNMGLLWDVRPAFVIVYDPDIAFVRQLEVGSIPLSIDRIMLSACR